MSVPMPNNDRYQDLMLEQVYGLLEEPDRLELEAYLATPEGAELARLGEVWKAKLAGAAKQSHPTVQFQPPTSLLAEPIRPSTNTKQKQTAWQRWALAACVVVVALLGIPAISQFSGWYVQRQEVLHAESELKEAEKLLAEARTESKSKTDSVVTKADELQRKQAELMKQYSDAIESARQSIEQKDFMVRLSGPAQIQPGAPNQWRIETLNKNWAFTLPKRLEIVMRDQTNRELLRETHDKPQAPSTFKLPTSFWETVKPNSELFLEVVAYNEDNHRSVLAEKVPLARPVFVTHLATDKPLYQPGEVVHYRSLTLERSTLLPPEHDMHLKFRLQDPSSAVTELDSGNGRVMDGTKAILGPDRKPIRGIGLGEYEIPVGAPGGEYSLQVFNTDSQTRIETLLDTRKFIVNAYVPDVFQKKLEFDGKSYGAGEFVQARLEASRTAGGPLANGVANVVASIEGVPFHTENNLKFNSKGVLNLRFKLPMNLGNGNASLAVTVIDGGQPETIVRPIPVIGKHLQVEFYPEGGDLVQGVPSRVYFQVKTPQGKPADLKGFITDGQQRLVDVRTETDADLPGVNRGQGVFSFTPVAGKNYFLKVETPTSIEPPVKEGFPLPKALVDGVILTSLESVTERGSPIKVNVQIGQGKKQLHIGAYARGKLLEHKRLEISAGQPTEVTLQGDEKLSGVTRVTVFEEIPNPTGARSNLIPKAERLLYRKPAQQLHLGINPDKSRYSPAGRVGLDLSAVNEKESATPAILMVGVVNQSVITMADNKTDRLMPTHFMIAGEVKNPGDLEHADFLMTDHPKASLALDLLLGTQGWRRFAEQQQAPLLPQDRPEVDRLLVANGQRTHAPLELYRVEEQRVNNEFQPKIEEVALNASEAEELRQQFFQEEAPALARKVSEAESTRLSRERSRLQATAQLYEYETRFDRLRSMAIPIFLLAVMSLAIISVILAVRQHANRMVYHVTAIGSLGLAILLLVGVYATSGKPNTEAAFAQLNDQPVKMAERNLPKMAAGVNVAPAALMVEDAPRADERRDPQAVPFAEPKMEMQAPRAPGIPLPLRAAPIANGIDKFAKPLDELKKAEKRDGKAEKEEQAKGGIMKDAARKQAVDRRAGPLAKVQGGLEQAKAKMRGLNQANRLHEELPMGKIAGPAAAMKPGAAPAFGAPQFPGGGPRPGFDMAPKDQMALEQTFPFIVREFAHQRDPNLKPEERTDFTETVYWHPLIVLPENGKTTINFQLSDAIATYQVLVAGHTVDGRIGALTKTIEARKPFTVDPKLPLEVNSNDLIDVAVNVVNDSDTSRSINFTLHPDGLKIDGEVKGSLSLNANSKGRQIYRLRPTQVGDAVLNVKANSTPIAEPDSPNRAVRVVQEGFPGVGVTSDMLEKSATGWVKLPKDMIKGTLKVKLDVYPTTMSDLVKGLDGLLREPNGCFEQTSTTNYPNTLILEYLQNSKQANPEVSKRAKELLDRGYARLTSFECPDTPAKLRQGFEWFGSPDMAHEALTAYGLLQFKDMAKVHNVDPLMIKRTQDFLLSRRDGKGGFKRNAQALDSFGGAPKHTTDAYIVWALVESDPDNKEGLDLKTEIAALKKQALTTDSREAKDSYFMALVANTLFLRDDRETAIKLMQVLQSRLTAQGSITGAETSITFSQGRDLEIETTAMTLLGWIRTKDVSFAASTKLATKWISQQRGGYGGFGSTQSTIMALKALIAHAKASAHPAESGEITLSIAGKRIASKKFTDQDVEVITLEIEKPEELFAAGKDTEVSIETTTKHPYPFSLATTYTTLTPVSAKECDVRLSTQLGKQVATEGESVPLSVSMKNLKNQGQGMAVAIIGLPAGMKVPTDMKQLTDLREKKVISYFELRGREVVLYWRNMAPNQQIDLTIDLVCDVPGEYRGPASRAYLYYSGDHRHWIDPLTIKINPLPEKEQTALSK